MIIVVNTELFFEVNPVYLSSFYFHMYLMYHCAYILEMVLSCNWVNIMFMCSAFLDITQCIVVVVISQKTTDFLHFAAEA